MTPRFRYIGPDGQEHHASDLIELADAIRAAKIKPTTLLYDSKTGRWEQARNHDVFAALEAADSEPIKRGRGSGNARFSSEGVRSWRTTPIPPSRNTEATGAAARSSKSESQDTSEDTDPFPQHQAPSQGPRSAPRNTKHGPGPRDDNKSPAYWKQWRDDILNFLGRGVGVIVSLILFGAVSFGIRFCVAQVRGLNEDPLASLPADVRPIVKSAPASHHRLFRRYIRDLEADMKAAGVDAQSVTTVARAARSPGAASVQNGLRRLDDESLVEHGHLFLRMMEVSDEPSCAAIGFGRATAVQVWTALVRLDSAAFGRYLVMTRVALNAEWRQTPVLVVDTAAANEVFTTVLQQWRERDLDAFNAAVDDPMSNPALSCRVARLLYRTILAMLEPDRSMLLRYLRQP